MNMPETTNTPQRPAAEPQLRQATLPGLLARAVVAVSHHSLATVGLAVAAALVLAWSQPALRSAVEAHTLGWLQERQDARAEPRPAVAPGETLEALARATATEPSSLTGEQAAVAEWLAKRYRIALEPVSRLVLEAWSIGPRAGLEPTLILAVAAVESAFNPFAQGSGGAKGLMQVVAHAHLEKFEPLGGLRAAFDPVSNLRVGALVLKESIAEAGSVEGGLLAYVGANSTSQQPGYPRRVLGEQSQLQQAAQKAQKGPGQAATDKPQTLAQAQATKGAPIH
jgi:soluble lytic murein transglycosylase-like protein